MATTDYTKYAFSGDIICVCGSFPTKESRASLTVDGRPLGEPLAASDRVVQVRIPSDLRPGWHFIRGKGVNGAADLIVLSVEGSIDRSKLLNGEWTQLRLRVRDTDEAAFSIERTR